MGKWKDFNATNQPDTCLWCGEKLRQIKGMWVLKDGKKTWDPEQPWEKKGDYGDGFFCTLRCAYQFGVKFAQWGRRFNPVGGAK